MRENKYKAWDKVEGRWLDAPWMRNGIFHIYDTSNGFLENRHILVEFTGRLDTSGKEIYEGDVLKDENGVVSVVIFDNAMFVGRTEDKMNAYKWRESEIIGDIYESPELDPRYKELKDDKIMETAREVKDGMEETNPELVK